MICVIGLFHLGADANNATAAGTTAIPSSNSTSNSTAAVATEGAAPTTAQNGTSATTPGSTDPEPTNGNLRLVFSPIQVFAALFSMMFALKL